MIRAWILFSTLAIGVVFELIHDPGQKKPTDAIINTIKFPFSDYELTAHTYWYFIIKYINGAAIILCLLINDSTPRWLLWLFLSLCGLDLIHFLLLYRSEGSGYNLFKIIIFGLSLTWAQIRSYRK